ncbi:hypothetical protein Taro_047585, partial [Colocasia esculenta]|nr:hypothetical protein [Colocasia esculenta]
ALPPRVDFCLNVDGACKGNPGVCGGGRCIISANGEVHLAFAFCYEYGNSMLAEVHALCDALVQSIISGVCPLWQSSWWWRVARSFLGKAGAQIVHVYRESNWVADALAKHACEGGVNMVFHSFNSLSSACKGPAILDKTGLPSIRLV